MLRRNNRGFTLLETILALALSSFIMLALTQAYRTLVTYIDRARDMARANQRIALVTQIIERDLSCAVMPQLHQEIESDKEKATKNDAPPAEEKKEAPLSTEEENKKKEEKRRDERRKYFFTEIDDTDLHKIKGQRVELLKTCNFITTSALEVYGESLPRWVRVRYELVRNKKAKVDEFTLVRKQTTDIHNVKMKISEVDPNADSKAHPITSHEVARGVKGLFIEFSMKKEPEKKDEKDKDKDKKIELEETKVFSWGESKKTAGELPQRAHVYLELWNETRDRADLIELEILMSVEGDIEKLLAEGKKKQEQKFGAGSPITSLASDVVAKQKAAQGAAQPQASLDDAEAAAQAAVVGKAMGSNP